MMKVNKTKTRFAGKLNTLFWWIVSLLPITLSVIACFGVFRTAGLWDYLDSGGYLFSDIVLDVGCALEHFCFKLGASDSSIVFTTLYDVFGADGVFPLFSYESSGFFLYFSYFVSVQIIRIMIDVLLFIPRLAHKWIGKACQDD